MEWWEPSLEPIGILWEYFHRRLNCTFYLLSDPLQSTAVICKSSVILLNQINGRLSTSVSNENSYNQFLQFLGNFLKYCTANNNLSHSQKLKGRIFFKFSPNKMAALDETGLHHFVSLFLTMAVTSDLTETVSRFGLLLHCID